MKKIKALTKPHILGVLALFMLILVWLFIFPHGMADNGDYYRIIHNLGLSHVGGNSNGDFFNYFREKFQLTEYYVDGKVSFLTSQIIVIWLSIQLNNIFMPDGVYDIRFLAAIYSAIYLAASWIILKLLGDFVQYSFKKASERYKTVVTYIFTALYVFVFGDFSYLLYFNSFFGEPLSFVMLLLYSALTAKIISSKAPGKGLLLLYFISAFMLIGAKQQNAPLGIVVAIFTLRMMILNKSRWWRTWTITATVLIAVFSVVTYTLISGEIQYLNKYHSITMGVMLYQDDSQDLKELDLSPQLMFLKDTTAYGRYPMALVDSPLMYDVMYDHVSPIKLAFYYIKHPNALQNILGDVAKNAYTIKPEMLGNYLKESGKDAGTQSYFFSGWSIMKTHIFPHTFGFILIFYLVLAGTLIIKYVQYFKEASRRGRLAVEFVYSIGIISLIQIAIAFLGAGEADLAKHLFLFDVTFDMLYIFAAFGVVYWLMNITAKQAR